MCWTVGHIWIDREPGVTVSWSCWVFIGIPRDKGGHSINSPYNGTTSISGNIRPRSPAPWGYSSSKESTNTAISPTPPVVPKLTVLEERKQPEGECGFGKSAPIFLACLVSGRKAGNGDMYETWHLCPPWMQKGKDFLILKMQMSSEKQRLFPGCFLYRDEWPWVPPHHSLKKK